MAKHVLITGHGGYIGSVMALYFVQAGHNVVGLDTGYFQPCTLVPDPVEIPSQSLLPHLFPGLPLPPDEYEAIVGDMLHRLVADSDVLDRYLKKQGPPLAHSASLGQLRGEPLELGRKKS